VNDITYYATYTTTRRNLAAMADAGIRLLFGPDQLEYVGALDVPTWGIRYALDNGAWGAFRRGGSFDGEAFWRVLDRWGDTFSPRGRFAGSAQRPDWIVCPDIVAGGMASLDLSLRWLPYVRQYGHPLIAVQDGMAPEAVEEHVGPAVGIFLGGSTAWKWATLPEWAAMARAYKARIHVGRVNTARGIRACRAHGVTSCDGTSASRFSVNAAPLGMACRGPVQIGMPSSFGVMS